MKVWILFSTSPHGHGHSVFATEALAIQAAAEIAEIYAKEEEFDDETNAAIFFAMAAKDHNKVLRVLDDYKTDYGWDGHNIEVSSTTVEEEEVEEVQVGG